ncbi:MAG: sulfotransferase [Alphaproteobacteria bacterium]|nr:sulfotransferase [Alphaproteobacteria bacterium]
MDPILRNALKALTQNRVDEAEAQTRAFLLGDYDNAVAWYVIGLCALKRENLFSGVALIEKALSINPKIAEAHQNLGVALSRIGRFEKAITHWRDAIALNPSSGECYQYLSEVKALPVTGTAFKAAKTLADNAAADTQQRRCAAFAVATALHGAEKFDKAFKYYKLGNRLAGTKSDVTVEKELLRRSQEMFNEDLFKSLRAFGDQTTRPLFVIGMPRSGTTLVEQVLSSHSQIGAAGELSDLTGMVSSLRKLKRGSEYPQILGSVPEDVLRKVLGDFAKQYSKRLAKFDSAARYVVDKAPSNYRFLGLISLMFPEAKIIYCQRSPMDIGLSCFQANFVGGQPWSFSLAGIAEKLKSHDAFIDFWRQVLPNSIHTVRYETLVSQTEQEAKRMIEFCGLRWEAQCTRPHENSGHVQTASKWQVRQPIHKGSVERWRRYEAELEPLRQALGDLVSEQPT